MYLPATRSRVCRPSPPSSQHDGRIYIQGGGVQPGGLTLSIYDPVTKQLRPCNASGSRDKRNYLWNDLNDDGLATRRRDSSG